MTSTIPSHSRGAAHMSDMLQLHSVHLDELQRVMDKDSSERQTLALLASDMPEAKCLCNTGAPGNIACKVMP